MLKINDKIVQIDRPELGVGIILGITHDPEALYSIEFPFLKCTRRRHQLKPYKDMKKERNITLTLDKAKEWYKKSGELKEVALQAYSEEELTKIELPKTWEEFCENYPVRKGECWLAEQDKILNCGIPDGDVYRRYKNWIPSKKSAEAHLAMIQLEQLRNCWWDGWKPDWSNNAKHVIKWEENDLIVFTCRRVHAFLVFPTEEMAKEFLECFKDLIKKAGDLI